MKKSLICILLAFALFICPISSTKAEAIATDTALLGIGALLIGGAGLGVIASNGGNFSNTTATIRQHLDNYCRFTGLNTFSFLRDIVSGSSLNLAGSAARLVFSPQSIGLIRGFFNWCATDTDLYHSSGFSFAGVHPAVGSQFPCAYSGFKISGTMFFDKSVLVIQGCWIKTSTSVRTTAFSRYPFRYKYVALEDDPSDKVWSDATFSHGLYHTSFDSISSLPELPGRYSIRDDFFPAFLGHQTFGILRDYVDPNISNAISGGSGLSVPLPQGLTGSNYDQVIDSFLQRLLDGYYDLVGTWENMRDGAQTVPDYHDIDVSNPSDDGAISMPSDTVVDGFGDLADNSDIVIGLGVLGQLLGQLIDHVGAIPRSIADVLTAEWADVLDIPDAIAGIPDLIAALPDAIAGTIADVINPAPDPSPDVPDPERSVISPLVDWGMNHLSVDDGLFSKFPFSIPYDLVLFVSGLTGETPSVGTSLSFSSSLGSSSAPVLKIDLPYFKNSSGGVSLISKTYDLNLSRFSNFATLTRSGSALLIMGYILISESRKWRK